MQSGRLGGVVVRTVALMIVRRVLGMLGCGATPDADAVEIAVLRHQLAVLHRQVPRARYTPADRMLLAALAKLLPRAVGGLPGDSHGRDPSHSAVTSCTLPPHGRGQRHP